jgi:hypothetical protein
MAVTAVVKKKARVPGSEKRTVTEVAMDNSYPTGGEVVTPKELGMRIVDFAICTVSAVGGTVNVAQAHYDTATGKLKLFDETPAEVANAADVSAIKVQVVAFGS